MKKLLFKYLLTYICPIPIYLANLFLIFGLGGELIYQYKIPELIVYLFLIIELATLISLFNFSVYKSSLTYVDPKLSLKIYKRIVIFNFVFSTFLMIIL